MQKRLNRSRCHLGADSCGSNEPCIRWDPDLHTRRGTLRGNMCRPIVTYLRMSALRTVRRLPRANVPAQCTRRTKAFATPRDDKTPMRPFAKLLWALVNYPANSQVDRQTDTHKSKHYPRQAVMAVTAYFIFSVDYIFSLFFRFWAVPCAR